MKKNVKIRHVITKDAADIFTPLSLVFGFYIILHGNLSPGGGFQGGVMIAASVVLIYLGYGYETASNAINMEVIRKGEAVAAIAYTVLALLGIFYGLNFCRNVFFNDGAIGELLSAGTIAFMNYAVGFKVLTGVSFLILLMVSLLAPDSDSEKK